MPALPLIQSNRKAYSISGIMNHRNTTDKPCNSICHLHHLCCETNMSTGPCVGDEDISGVGEMIILPTMGCVPCDEMLYLNGNTNLLLHAVS